MSRDARTIQETRQAVTLIVEAFHRWQQANRDGDVTFREWLGFSVMVPAVWEAIENATSIPRELADLDGLEADELIEMVATVINSKIDTQERRVKIDKVLIAFHAIADAAAQWRGVNPPGAEVVG